MEHTRIPREELEVFAKLEDIDVVFDIGTRSDIDYLLIKPDIELHAFEPAPPFFKQLQEAVLKTDGKGKVYLNNFGLGDTDDSIDYDTNRQAFWNGECPVTCKHLQLPIKTLNWYVKEYDIKHIDFLKIDVEGYEFKVFKGGSDIIKKCKYIQYEYWDNKGEYHDLLGEDFDMEYMGYRNVLCMNKKLVKEETRKKIKDYIISNNFANLS